MKRFSSVMMITFLSSAAVEAQNLFTNNNSLVVIEAEVPVTILGGVSNSGDFDNEGALRLHGDWANSGDYRSVSGTFSIEGTNLTFDPGDWTYRNLSVNVSGEVIIPSNLTISGELELISGILTFQNDASIFIQENAIISGGDETAYINGTLYTSQEGNLTFPIGTSTEYLPVTLQGVVSTEPVGVRAVSEELLTSISEGIDAFSPNRYWEILQNNNFIASAITLPVINEDFIESSDEAVIGYTETPINPVTILGIPTFAGTTSSGTINTEIPIRSGYYLLADKSVGGPPIRVINVVTPLQDGKHDFLRIENIEFYENNVVEIFDRSGNKVFEMTGYNNADRVFTGNSNVGGRGVLTTGSYYYTIKLTGNKRDVGFVYIKN